MPQMSNADLILRAAKSIDALLSEAGRKVKLTRCQMEVLLMIQANPGISQAGMLALSTIDRSTVAGVVRRLTKRGLIKRTDNPDDARAYSCMLSAKGTTVADVATKIKREVDRTVDGAVNSAVSFGGRLEAVTQQKASTTKAAA